MGLINTIRSRQDRAIQSVPWRPQDWASGADITASWGAGYITPEGAMQLDTVYGCVGVIADGISLLPVGQFRKSAMPGGTLTPMVLSPWLQDPSIDPDTGWIDIISQTVVSLLLRGNAWWIVMRGGEFDGTSVRGAVRAIEVINPDRVTLLVTPSGSHWMIDGRPTTGELKHIKALTMPGAKLGIDPICHAARKSISSSTAQEEFTDRFFQQGTLMSGVIQIPGNPTPDQLRRFRENWQEQFSGLRNAHLPGVLFGGAAWQSISITPEQAQLLDSRKYSSRSIVSMIFKLPADLLGLDTAGSSLTYQNLEMRWTDVARRAFMPYIRRIEEAINSLLPKPQVVKMDMSEYQRPDWKTRWTVNIAAVGAGLMTPNEARTPEGLPPIEGGDEMKKPAPPPDIVPPGEDDAPDDGENVVESDANKAGSKGA